ncbi:SDR family NAD(P)-dependent oxidoreductase [Paenactinomyces guangxiensis]|uniref:SDR family NAD(P)-dependent oxidoreductase n=1 Tax=Paenactinomyces guangxiensis TaxID=1490290 RepID=A0A7W2A950_9BACL|nr:SDR family NAD(P)-dependent oxidoreductase [Paenactinomyces guangxiensis]MBA4496261.1 SDR family NAD(P)-dependent oxidoreductase [Paenactinomyces guangxiensis]MBH8593357.1 SDR family NAD(P)-dependent oxidoreductase [Paenactinomyces guangxiensis]
MSQKIAIVTGASRLKGIGAAICHALADAGLSIFFTYWSRYDQEGLGIEQGEPEQLKQDIRRKGVNCQSLELDLSQEHQLQPLITNVRNKMGEPDVLVNNAVYSVNGDYQTITARELDAHYAVNIRAVVMLSVEFARQFQKGTGGRIINLTSGQSLGPMPGELCRGKLLFRSDRIFEKTLFKIRI